MSHLKTPEESTSLNDIRQGIDFYDREIFTALQKRLRYVKAAAQFKASEEDIPAPARVTAMLAERRQWAEQADFDPAFIEQLYSLIIHWNIQQQIDYWRETHR